MQLSPIIEPNQVKRIISSMKSKKLSIFCWQPTDDEQKVGFTVNSSNLVMGERLLVFCEQDTSIFTSDEYLFFYYEPKTIIFKAKIKTIYPGHIVCEIPEELKLRETRQCLRYLIAHGSTFLSISIKNKNSTPTRYRVKLMDISESGASFSIDNHQKEKIDQHAQINIHALSSLIVTPILGCSVCYVTGFKISGKDEFKVGVKFERLLTPSEINAVTSA